MSSCTQFWTIVFGIAVVLFLIVVGGAGDIVEYGALTTRTPRKDRGRNRPR